MLSHHATLAVCCAAVGGPCLVALADYDSVASLLYKRGAYPHIGRAILYAITVTPRVTTVIETYPTKARRVCLIMLGLGLAWYEVVCTPLSQKLAKSAGSITGLLVLVVIPVILAPRYVEWLRTKVPRDRLATGGRKDS